MLEEEVTTYYKTLQDANFELQTGIINETVKTLNHLNMEVANMLNSQTGEIHKRILAKTLKNALQGASYLFKKPCLHRPYDPCFDKHRI